MTQVKQEAANSKKEFRDSLGKEQQAIYDVLVGCIQSAPSQKKYDSVQAYFEGEGILDQKGNLSPTHFIKKEIKSWFDRSREDFERVLIRIQGEKKFGSVSEFSKWIKIILTPLKYQKAFFIQYYEKAENENNRGPFSFSIISQLEDFLIYLYETRNISEIKFIETPQQTSQPTSDVNL